MPRRRRWLRCGVVSLLALGAVLVVLWLARAPLLRGAARLWTVSDPLEKADAILVLGGGVENRPFAAARLYHEGFATNIILFNVRPSPTEKLGLSGSHADHNRAVLLQKGVPPAAILTIGTDVSSTRDEAAAVRDWVKAAGPKRLILPTEFPHTRRARWIFEKTLAGTGTRLLMDPIDSWDYTQEEWWREEQGLVSFQNEVCKFVYYRLKH